MSHPASVRVSIDVEVEPHAAFEVFTAEIDAWYQRGRHSFTNPKRAVGIRFEGGAGGRLVELYDAQSGEGRTMAEVTVWEPGARLVFVDNRGTEVEVRFEAVGPNTRVTLEHRGLERLRPELAERHARHGWRLLIPWYSGYLATREAREGIGDE